MKVINREKERLPSSITPHELGQAMSALDLSGVPPSKRRAAIKDHLMRVMANTIHDRQTALEIHAARLLHLAKMS
jgi:hypothetical protein